MSESKVINPDGELLPEIRERLFLARKIASIWAIQVDDPRLVETREGPVSVTPGDFLCRGIQDELWPQSKETLFHKYDSTGEIDEQGWQRFDPKSDMSPVEAAQIDYPFCVVVEKRLSGNAGDYVVRNSTSKEDIWIVGKTIFESTYQRVE